MSWGVLNIPAWMAPADKEALLSVLVDKQPISVLEIGVFAGSTTQSISTVPSVKQITSIDTFDLRYISTPALERLGLDRSFDPLNVFLQFLDELSQRRPDIDHVIRQEVVTKSTELDDHYDLIFVDADRSTRWLVDMLPIFRKRCDMLVGSHYNFGYAPELVVTVDSLFPNVQTIEKTNIWYDC